VRPSYRYLVILVNSRAVLVDQPGATYAYAVSEDRRNKRGRHYATGTGLTRLAARVDQGLIDLL
jgi:hypothetical protein